MTLLQMSVMGAVLICLIILLRKLAGDRLPPSCYLLLWLMAGLRLLVPLHITSSFSVYNFLQRTQMVMPKIIPDIGTVNAVDAWVNAGITEQTAHVSINWLFVVWLTGAIVCMLMLLTTHWNSRRVYVEALPMQEPFVVQWKASHPLHRRYQIRQCQQITTPLTYGVICPVILLPSGQNMRDEELHMVLLHEWNHIRHWDVLWQWGLALICCVHWFNPAVWVMLVLCRQDLELFCDRATAQQLTGNQCRQYAFLLLQQASTAPHQALFFSQFCFIGYHRMEERIKIIMKQKKTTWKTITATGVLLGAGFLFFATSASGEVNGADKWLSIGTDTTQTEQTGQVDAKITKMQWPVASEDAIVTLQFGKRVHPVTGEEKVIDHICIGGVEKGTDIIAAAAGVVKETGFDIRNGNYLILDHGGNLETRYWHCETLQVKDGQSVSAGEKIATLGQTGDATGPCLSFAVYQDGEACDPMNWVE